MNKLLDQATSRLYTEKFSAKNIDASKFFFDHLLYYYIASCVVLREQDVIPRERTRRLVEALFKLSEGGVDSLDLDPGLEDLVPNVERAIVDMIGPVDASDLGIARARAEFGHVAAHLALRDELLDTIEQVTVLNEDALDFAHRNLNSFIPYYTQHMRAEPITFGYYFSSFNEAFAANGRRLRDSYGRYLPSIAGVGHIVPTPIPVDRDRLAQLLGLGKPVHHSLYAYLNGDCYVDTLSAAALMGSSLSRLNLDFWWWASSDLRVLTFSDEWCGGSFIMPHKRNPSWLKALRFATIGVKLRLDEALETWSHSTPMLLVGALTTPLHAYRGMQDLRYAMELVSGNLRTMEVDRERGRELAGRDFTQSSQLVSLLVRKQQTGWRLAEHVVGKLVKEAVDSGKAAEDMTHQRFVEIGKELLGEDIKVTPAEFADALVIEEIVNSRGDCGPAPDAVAKAIAAQRADAEETRKWVREEKARLAAARTKTFELARQI